MRSQIAINKEISHRLGDLLCKSCAVLALLRHREQKEENLVRDYRFL